MSTTPIYQKLYDGDALFDVPGDQMIVLRPQDTKSAVGVRNLKGCACIVLMGTTARSAIAVAHIADLLSNGHTSGGSPKSVESGSATMMGEMHYMHLLRRVLDVFLKEPDLFQMPLAWGIFARHESEVPMDHLRQRTSSVLRHLQVQMKVSLYEVEPPTAGLLQPGNRTAVVVRHRAELPEIYVDDRLVYPSDHSGSLALVFNELGIPQNREEQVNVYDRNENTDAGAGEAQEDHYLV